MKLKWTILFLVHASDSETRKYADQLFKILETAEHNEKIKLLVLYGAYQSSNEGVHKIQVILKEFEKSSSTASSGLRQVGESYGRIDMGNEKELTDIFSKIRAKYPSERFLLFTWDHGTGFGIFKTDPRTRGVGEGERDLDAAEILIDFHSNEFRGAGPVESIEDSFQLSVITSEPVKEVYLEGISHMREAEKKRIKTSMLTNDELRNIIKNCAKDGKVDLLIMMNCMMQMIETGYALNDAVEYLIAPQTCIFWAGYDYISIINKLCSNPEIETEAIAKHALDTIQEYYQSTPLKNDFNNLVISLVKPARSKEVKNMIDKLAGNLNKKLTWLFDDIKSTRRKSTDLSRKYVNIPFHYIDLLAYVNSLYTNSDQFNFDIHQLKKIKETYVVQILKGSNYSKLNKDGIGEVNGFTIYFPPTSSKAHNDFYYEWFYMDGEFQTLFAKDSEWKHFLVKYVEADENNKIK